MDILIALVSSVFSDSLSLSLSLSSLLSSSFDAWLPLSFSVLASFLAFEFRIIYKYARIAPYA